VEAEAEADSAVERMRSEAMSEDRAKQQTEIRWRVVLPAQFRGCSILILSRQKALEDRAAAKKTIPRRHRFLTAHTPRKQCGIAVLYKAFVRGPSAAAAANSLALQRKKHQFNCDNTSPRCHRRLKCHTFSMLLPCLTPGPPTR
jgi:hypothetical protein